MDNFDKTQNICRICLVENNEKIQSIFDTINSTTESLKFSEMLMTCTKVAIISGDELPNQICSTCAQNTIKLYLFKIKCEESDKTLRNRLNGDLCIDKKVIDAEDILEIKLEIKEEPVELLYDVLNDSRSYSHCVQQNENNLLDNVVYEDYEACASSPKYSESLNTFNNSITTDSKLPTTEDSLEEEKDLLHRKKIVEVTETIKMIDQKLESQKHEINLDKYGIKKSLVVCLEDCNKIPTLKNSINKSYKDKKTIFTPTPGKSLSDSKDNLRQQSVRDDVTKSNSLANHKRIDSIKILYGCDLCNKIFSSSSSFKVHKKFKHASEKRECDVCKIKFYGLHDLSRHKLKHTDEKPYECNVCKNRFATSSYLADHKRIHIHTGEKTYECDVCKRGFSVLSHLIAHKRTHTGEKLHECDVCKLRFKRKSDLIVHKRIHTGEKPYECDVCKSRFKASGDLNNHKRIHTGEKPYECEVCKRRFRQSGALARHKRIHTGERPYKCDFCEKKKNNHLFNQVYC